MNAKIPTAAEVRQALERQTTAQLRDLAERSKVPFSTLWKVRSGETQNPGIETVGQFWPELVGTEGAPQPQEIRDAA